MASKCPLKWVEQLAEYGVTECPYGVARMSVTWPDPMKASRMRTEFPNATIEYDWLNDDFVQNRFFTSVFAFYGYIPYLIMLLAGARLLWQPTTKLLSFCSFAICSTLINELILKNIIQQHRPEHSCVTSCGMPSGHSTLAIGYVTLNLLDLILRVYYMPNYSIVGPQQRGGRHRWDHIKRILGSASLTPLAKQTEITHAQMIFSLLYWTVLLVPVPLSRVAVRDHTPSQALMGSVIGIVEASGWTCWMRHLMYKYKNKTGKSKDFCWWKLEYDYVLPYFAYLAKTSVTDRQESITDWYKKQGEVDHRDRFDFLYWRNHLESIQCDQPREFGESTQIRNDGDAANTSNNNNGLLADELEVRLMVNYHTIPGQILTGRAFYKQGSRDRFEIGNVVWHCHGSHGKCYWFSSPLTLEVSQLIGAHGGLYVQYAVYDHAQAYREHKPRVNSQERCLDPQFWQKIKAQAFVGEDLYCDGDARHAASCWLSMAQLSCETCRKTVKRMETTTKGCNVYKVVTLEVPWSKDEEPQHRCPAYEATVTCPSSELLRRKKQYEEVLARALKSEKELEELQESFARVSKSERELAEIKKSMLDDLPQGPQDGKDEKNMEIQPPNSSTAPS